MATELLKITSLSKTFPGVKALDKVDFELDSGEIRALVGENGAGKTTLIKILAGIYQKDSGSIIYQDTELDLREPAEAKELGLAFIHQDLNLIPYFDVVENIWLGYDYPRKGLRFDKKAMQKRVLDLAARLNFKLDFDRPVSQLSTADKWLVAILKAFIVEAKLIVLDEPTAALTDKEVKELFLNLRRVKAMGISIIYISHRLEEIFQVADSITVLRNGKKIADRQVKDVTKDSLIKLMTGKDKLTSFPGREDKQVKKENILQASQLKGAGYSNVNFSLKENEILGFFGLVGSGRTELMESIFGLRKIEAGLLKINDKKIDVKNPAQMIREGVVLVPEDRREKGLVLNLGVDENISLPNLELMLKSNYLKNIDKDQEKQQTEEIVSDLRIKTPSFAQPVKFLSGGNQQKVVIAKWLYRDTKVFIFDEPTVGIDVGARTEVYSLINELASDAGVIVVSSDILEVMGICDRIAVMSRGRLTGILAKENFNQDKILRLAYEEVK
ncbi:MAG: sugar ABC transporter ATP-binding protein [Bacillota bacterium]